MPEEKRCKECCNLENGYCKKWKVVIVDDTVVTDCHHYNIPLKMNKGLEIRNKKLERHRKERATVKESQQELARFVEYKELVIEKINGKYRKPTRREQGRRVQIKNRIYLEDGKRFKLVNRSTLQIKKIYTEVPKWATQEQIEKYQRFCKEHLKKNDETSK